MKRIYVVLLALALCSLSAEISWSKKKDGPSPYDGEGFIPPGQAKPHGPPPWAPAHGYRAKQRYRYYPAYNIYQDPATGVYFSFRGGLWSRGGLPAGVAPQTLGKYHEFDGYADEPWKSYPPKK